MTPQPSAPLKFPPFVSPLVSASTAASTAEDLHEISGGVQELRHRITSHGLDHTQVVRRLYQIEAALDQATVKVTSAGLVHQRRQASALLAAMLNGYDVGRQVDGDPNIHITDAENEHGPNFANSLCGIGLDLRFNNLGDIRPGPLCPTCCVEFVRRVMNPVHEHPCAILDQPDDTPPAAVEEEPQ